MTSLPLWRLPRVAARRDDAPIDSLGKFCDSPLVPRDALPWSVGNEELTILDFEGLREYRISPVLPLQPMRGVSDAHEMRRDFRRRGMRWPKQPTCHSRYISAGQTVGPAVRATIAHGPIQRVVRLHEPHRRLLRRSAMRVCQPGPVAFHRSMTSTGSRIEMSLRGFAERGRPPLFTAARDKA